MAWTLSAPLTIICPSWRNLPNQSKGIPMLRLSAVLIVLAVGACSSTKPLHELRTDCKNGKSSACQAVKQNDKLL